MNIAIDISWFASGQQPMQRVLLQLLDQLLSARPDDRFIFFIQAGQQAVETRFQRAILLPVIPLADRSVAGWYKRQLPDVLQQQQAAVFIGRPGWVTPVKNVAQVGWLTSNPLQYPAGTASWWSRWQYRRQKPEMLQNASILLAANAWQAARWSSAWPAISSRIRYLPPLPATDMLQLSFDEKQRIRNQYSDGKNYFLALGPFDAQSNIITLLKAFSRFKKRQKTEWKLVLAGSVDTAYPQFSASLATYKYRADICLLDQATDEEQQQLLAAAYALIVPAQQQVENIRLTRAWAAGIPQLLPAAPENEIWAKDAALYVEIVQHEAIADQLMRLYKDEDFYNRLRQAASQRNQEHQWPAVMDWFNTLFTTLRDQPDRSGV